MNKKLIMIRYEFLNSFKSEKNRYLFILLYALGSIFMFGIFFAGTYANLLESPEDMSIKITMMILGVFMSGIFLTIYNILFMGESLFKFKDFATLASLPIKDEDIIIGKMSVLFFYNLLICTVVNFSNFFAIWVIEKNTLFLIYSLIFNFFLALFYITLGIIISYIIRKISSKMKNTSLVMTLSSALMIACIVIFANYFENIGATTEAEIMEIFTNTFIGQFLINLFISYNFYYLIIFSAVTVLFFIFILWLTSKDYKKVVNSFDVSIKTKDYVMSQQKSNGKIMGLVEKDIRNIFRTPVYLLNSMIGLVFLVISSTMLVINKNKILNNKEFQIPPEIVNYVPLIAILFAMIFLMITFVNSATISLEGGNINLLKTLPLSTKDILFSKILSCFIVIAPLTYLSCIIISIGFKYTFFQILLSLIGVTFAILINCQMFLLVNLVFPKFKWVNLNQVIKNSASVLISMILGIVIIGIIILILIVTKGSIMSLLIFQFALNMICYFGLIKFGVRKFDSYII